MSEPTRPLRVGIYARVSTADQKCENQLHDLRRYAQDRGWTVVDEFLDEGVSGSKAKRPGMNRLMDAARKRHIDTVLVWRFDRFARSVKHLVEALADFRDLGIQFVSYQENIDTGSPLGQAIYTIIAAMAQLERDIIVERVRAGLRRARLEGKRLGRPRCDLDPERLRKMQNEGLSLGKIAKALGVSKATVHRAVSNPA